MKKSLFAVALVCTALLSSCFGTTGGLGSTTSTSSTPRPAAASNSAAATTSTSTTTTSTASTTNTSSNAASALGTILSGVTGNSSTSSLLGSIIGAFGGTTSATTIIGSWTYQSPSVQFESSNLLAQAGGAVASQTIANKLSPYYEKIGIKPGVAKLVLNQNNACQITLSNKTINGTYTYDSNAGTLTVKGSTGIKLFTAYISVSLNQLSLTLDTSNLLSMMTNLGSGSNNSTLSSISGVAGSFSGMKTGFLFTK